MMFATRLALRSAASAAALTLLVAAAFAQSNPLTDQPGHGPEPEAGVAMEPQGAAEERATVNPSATEIIRSLAPFADGNPNAPRQYRDVDAGGRTVRVDYGRAVDLTVFFLYDSFQLTPEARIQLEPLGRALQSEKLAGFRFLIAGHTDAAGSDAYNRGLSARRAAAVKRYLVEAFDIEPSRLVAYGWGESRLKDRGNPLSRVNRRVEVALIAPPRRSSSLERSRLGYEGPQGLRHDVSGDDGCGLEEMTDPRLRKPLDLDDFGAAPAAVCAETLNMDDLELAPRR
ncbi:OmpA family protein [Chenggangzhangella methanolivorans]|uniref:OmpA family protein n=1 Tax=Chenggangzhangella methanolivorans TaxID=1437009 RepID=A0A9E6R8S1_9HYPH|nr:OmpA family protein [Chenggangzhangella methanolivorans]QZN98707.1 OmpA family protein [Chenggangzhangella methanolivorans]